MSGDGLFIKKVRTDRVTLVVRVLSVWKEVTVPESAAADRLAAIVTDGTATFCVSTGANNVSEQARVRFFLSFDKCFRLVSRFMSYVFALLLVHSSNSVS